jgi:hypothetical protein
MRTISTKELTRMKKKGGVKVKRRLGTKSKKPESEAEDTKVLSGPEPSETPVPALPPVPALDTQAIASMAASMAARDAHMEAIVTNNTRVIEKFKKDLQKPEKLTAFQRADFVRHKVVRDKKSNLMDYIDSIPMEN